MGPAEITILAGLCIAIISAIAICAIVAAQIAGRLGMCSARKQRYDIREYGAVSPNAERSAAQQAAQPFFEHPNEPAARVPAQNGFLRASDSIMLSITGLVAVIAVSSFAYVVYLDYFRPPVVLR